MTWFAEKELSKYPTQAVFTFLITGLRILIGWHFLYEGMIKLFTPEWTATGYLVGSQWLFSFIFHWIAENPVLLVIANQITIWGSIVTGLALFLGVFTRAASAVGATFILLFYIAQPPLIGLVGEATGEGHYLIVNKNLIEFLVLTIFIFLPQTAFYGLDRWWHRLFSKQAKTENEIVSDNTVARREFLKDLVALPFLGGFILSVFHKRQWESFEERNLISQPSRVDATSGASPIGQSYKTLVDLKAKVPHGKIGDYQISRLICGGNLISAFAHSRDLIYVSSLVKNYFSDEKVLETMDLCEACGINTIILRVDTNTLRIMKKYRHRNGKMHWIAQVKIRESDIASDIDAAVDHGAMGAYIHGGVADDCVAAGQVGLLLQAVEYVKNKKVLAGMAGHDLNVIVACEKAGLDPDFYMKTINSGNYWTAGPRLKDPDWQPDPFTKIEPEYNKMIKDNIWEVTPRQTAEFMTTVKKPWISYKVLGAGAIKPKEGFQYAFENGADFACVGMFDFQIVENVNSLNEVLNSLGQEKDPGIHKYRKFSMHQEFFYLRLVTFGKIFKLAADAYFFKRFIGQRPGDQ